LKKVLITGANSYVGTNVEKWLLKESGKFHVVTLDMKNPNWREFDFSKFDVVFHIAGIAHVSQKKSMEDLYYKINRDLAIETCTKAKNSGVKKFIFMSSMIVYNSSETIVSANTIPNPDSFYGLSKLQAEEGIMKLNDDYFSITILRSPMIFGSDSKGNFNRLFKFALKAFLFPNFINRRSVLFVDNLAIYILHIIKHDISGIIFPSNYEYLCVSNFVKDIRKINGKKTVLTKIFNIPINFLRKRNSLFKKIFGDFYYENDLINLHEELVLFSYDDSLVKLFQ
jgi:nucleoside-diphosphate-sugar epimerase